MCYDGDIEVCPVVDIPPWPKKQVEIKMSPAYGPGTSRFGTRSQGLHCCQGECIDRQPTTLWVPGRSSATFVLPVMPVNHSVMPASHLRAILSLELMDTAVVVTPPLRQKLGIRGLISLRRHCHPSPGCRRTVDKVITETFQLVLDYPELDQCLYLVRKSDGQVVTADYQQQVTLRGYPALRLPTLSAWQNIAQLETG